VGVDAAGNGRRLFPRLRPERLRLGGSTVRGLGLKWRSHTVELDDTPEVRGMIGKVAYMLSVTEGRQG